MRKYSFLSAFIFAFLFQSCRGPEGIPGPQGPQGPAGDGLIARIFEVEADFTAAGEYRNSIGMPSELEVYETDVVLVYLHYNTVTVNGNQARVWRALPQVIPAGDGFFQYNFDYTMYDVEFFLEGNIDLSTLDNSWTQDQIFRVVVLPADEIGARKAAVDFNNYEEVVKAYGIDESKVVKVIAQ